MSQLTLPPTRDLHDEPYTSAADARADLETLAAELPAAEQMIDGAWDLAERLRGVDRDALSVRCDEAMQGYRTFAIRLQRLRDELQRQAVGGKERAA